MSVEYYMLIAVIVLSYIAIWVLEARHKRERDDLLNRIMARDYNEYVHTVKPGPAVSQRNSYKEALLRAEKMNDEG